MAVTVNPLSDACGAEILGVDMKAALSNDDASTIYQGWLNHLVIVIRNQQDLTPADQKQFCSNFGYR